jgi:hypothetical protein
MAIGNHTTWLTNFAIHANYSHLANCVKIDPIAATIGQQTACAEHRFPRNPLVSADVWAKWANIKPIIKYEIRSRKFQNQHPVQ